MRPGYWIAVSFVWLWLLGKAVEHWTAPALQQQRIDYADPGNPCDGVKDREMNPWCIAYVRP